MKRRGIHRQDGFTLLEVLVAFALLAMALTLLLGAMSNATRQVRGAGDASRATLHAQSLLAQTGVGEVLSPGLLEGDFERGRYRWEMRIEPFSDPLAAPVAPSDPMAPDLLQLTLDVRWGERPEQRLHWETLRLVPPGAVEPSL